MATNQTATTNFYYNTGQYVGEPIDPNIKELKRLIVWKNLRIKSISINTESIIIEGIRNRKIYFIVISKNSIKIFDNKMKELDSIQIPVPYEDIYKWGKTAVGTATDPYWVSSGGPTTSAGLAPWTTSTCGNEYVDQGFESTWTSSSCYKLSFE
jgi:hypothetical protein